MILQVYVLFIGVFGGVDKVQACCLLLLFERFIRITGRKNHVIFLIMFWKDFSAISKNKIYTIFTKIIFVYLFYL